MNKSMNKVPTVWRSDAAAHQQRHWFDPRLWPRDPSCCSYWRWCLRVGVRFFLPKRWSNPKPPISHYHDWVSLLIQIHTQLWRTLLIKGEDIEEKNYEKPSPLSRKKEAAATMETDAHTVVSQVGKSRIDCVQKRTTSRTSIVAVVWFIE